MKTKIFLILISCLAADAMAMQKPRFSFEVCEPSHCFMCKERHTVIPCSGCAQRLIPFLKSFTKSENIDSNSVGQEGQLTEKEKLFVLSDEAEACILREVFKGKGLKEMLAASVLFHERLQLMGQLHKYYAASIFARKDSVVAATKKLEERKSSLKFESVSSKPNSQIQTQQAAHPAQANATPPQIQVSTSSMNMPRVPLPAKEKPKKSSAKSPAPKKDDKVESGCCS
jgi:hypothetical protein